MKTREKKKKHAKYVVHLNLFLFLSKEKSYLTKADRLTYSDKAVPYTHSGADTKEDSVIQ